jgi:hypothetical protein
MADAVGTIIGFVSGVMLALGVLSSWPTLPPVLAVAAVFLTAAGCGWGGGALADALFRKPRRYDPDYDDRPPTDPAR